MRGRPVAEPSVRSRRSPFLGIGESWPEVETKLELASKIEDPWEMLGIDRDATRADIKKAYRTSWPAFTPIRLAWTPRSISRGRELLNCVRPTSRCWTRASAG